MFQQQQHAEVKAEGNALLTFLNLISNMDNIILFVIIAL